jgi:hypothetical protein
MVYRLASFATVFALLPCIAAAVPVASDNSANLPYQAESGGAWKGILPSTGENPPGTDNGGYGFQPWNFSGGFHDPIYSPYGNLNHFIDGVDFSHSTFNNLGSRAFGLTNANIAQFGFTARATRVFSQPLAVGGTFTIDFDNPVLAPLKNNDTTGYLVRLNTGSGPKIASNPDVFERLGIFALDGFLQQRWARADASGNIDTGLSTMATTSGARLSVTLQSAESYLLQLLPLGGGSPLYSATGNLSNTGKGSIDTVEIVMFGNGSGNGSTGIAAQPTGQREFFFDRIVLNNPFTGLAGDYTRDGVVDVGDYLYWRSSLDDSIPNGSGADGDWDGVVTELDYNIWRQNFGAQAPPGFSESISPLRVPEPSTSVLVFAVSALIAWKFDNRTSRRNRLSDKTSNR